MRNLNRSISTRYKNLRIKYKLIVFISILLIVCLTFIIIGFQYAFNSYDEQIYRKSSQVLIMSSNRIEDELKNIEEVTYKIMGDDVIQNALLRSKDNSLTKYDQYQIEKEIWETLTSYIGSEKYIQSIHLFDRFGKEYRAGGVPSRNLYDHKDEMIIKAEKGNGSNVWISLEGSKNSIFSTRQLKSYENLSLEKLGTLVIDVKLHEIVKELPKEWEDQEGYIAISEGDEIFFSEGNSTNVDKLDFTASDKQGYQIQNVYGRSFFVTYSKSPYANWTYWNVLPFGTMFAKVTMIKFLVIFLFLAISISSIYLVIRFSKRITNPIENLVSAMKFVQKEDFKLTENFTPSQYQDEVGMLHRNFFVMIERINQLINENYEKQLLIKDTEFKALQSQINPHFLYNTLESINWLAKVNQQHQISKMVESLGYLLRNAISLKDDVITVEQEVEMVEHYVTIQKFRFEERLEFSLVMDDKVKNAKLPKLILQPLVENAIHYALEMMIEPCEICLLAFKEGDKLRLVVEDNGPGMDEQQLELVKKGEIKTRGNGIGLRNIDSRIKFVFGTEYGLQIDSEVNKGTKVCIVIPYQTRWDYV
ncbi:cache domain-containing sensor histidine kinase [Metabacillus sp. B2-18]|uniref:cache domain-containing sensor histidine kinase n=1 Tax=Metabacillus sp. B2-18 TaxID=2897333 RepID=UPI001E2AABAE|nr:sensor histidine kinase [Metabacillus sp. B2-18]UGB32044.1 sensor histidine kinase [Metabacillus sp. B2-18]